jgi:pimeloyl-ACP methyl ester carboxylesterase
MLFHRSVFVFVACGALACEAARSPEDEPRDPPAAPSAPRAAASDSAIRPFHVHVPDEALDDLHKRLDMTRWPDREIVNDRSQGAQLDKVHGLVSYWRNRYDWRKAEAKLNALPQFTTTIDGEEIYFIHVKSKYPNAMPLIITHGWPGSVFEMLKVIGPLTDPVAYGGKPEDAFDVVIPAMPGYGFSAVPHRTGWGPDHIARAWAILMQQRLGYKQYVAAGGDWGSVVAHRMAKLGAPGLIGIHVNMPATVPADVAQSLLLGDPPPPSLSPEEKRAYEALARLYTKGSGYASIMVTRPQTLGYALSDSPVALASWFYDKFADWTYTNGDPERALTKDEMLDNITLYWLTNTGTSSARLYWENNANNFNAVDLTIPTAITVFPGEIYRAPRSWAERAYHKLVYFHEVSKGGHFAAWEQPELYAAELRAGFKPMRAELKQQP